MSSRPSIPIKVLCTGDGMVGKTALLHRFTAPEEDFLDNYDPTIFDEYQKTKTAKSGQEYNMKLIDTAGQEELASIMAAGFNNTDVFILCFSPTNSNSFANIKTSQGNYGKSWIEMIRNATYQSRRPEIILVMTKSDLLKDEETLTGLEKKKRHVVTRQQAEKMKREIKAFRLVECSARNNEGVTDVFEAATEAVDRHNGRPWCQIL